MMSTTMLNAVALLVLIFTSTMLVQARLNHESHVGKSPFPFDRTAFLADHSPRRLQTVPIPPTRTCGQNLGITSRDVISGLIQSLGQAFGNVTLDQNVNYDVQAIVHCGSCADVATTDLLADIEGFGSYCAEGSYGFNVTHSGLLLLPIDSETNEIIANQKLKGSVFLHSITTDTTLAPSEVFPEDLGAFLQNAPDPAVAFGSLYNVMGGLIAASSGVVSLVPVRVHVFVFVAQCLRTWTLTSPYLFSLVAGLCRVWTIIIVHDKKFWLQTLSSGNRSSLVTSTVCPFGLHGRLYPT